MANEIYTLATIIVQESIDLMRQHGFIITMLALFGAIGLFGAIINKSLQVLKYIFYIFFVVPIIIVIGLWKKSERKQRLKELGEIRAFAKSHPDRVRKILYYILAMVLVVVILVVAYEVIVRIIAPIYQFNEVTKVLLNNSNVSLNTS